MVEVNKNNLGKLIVEYQPQLKSFIRKRVTNREDILQDVFYQLAKAVNGTMNPIEHVSTRIFCIPKTGSMPEQKRVNQYYRVYTLFYSLFSTCLKYFPCSFVFNNRGRQ
jgi:hypothetical protein